MKRFERRLINLPMVARVIGWLMMIEGIFMSIPLVTCILYEETDWLAFAISIGVTFATGAAMTFCLHPRRTDMGKREGFLLTALVWVIFSFFGMLPFLLCSSAVSFSDAFFEAMSGFTTTGATVMNTISEFSHGILLWRCLMQWIGGMGIILFTLAVIPMLNHSGGMQMFNAEVTGITHDKIRPRISQTAKSLWGTYIVLTIMLFALLALGPMNIFDALCHAFSTISTGGFSSEDNGVATWESSLYVKIVITVFMFLGGVNFVVIFKAATRGLYSVRHNEALNTYLGVVGVTFVIFVIAIVARGHFDSWESVTVDPLFMIISTITSTGYAVVNFEAWGTFVLTLIFVLMFFGACAGSTSGGAKIDRIIYLAKNIRNELDRCVHPNTMMPVTVGGKIMSPEIVNKVIAFLCIYVLLILFGGIVLTAFGIPLVDAFFSAFSCVGNTGLGAGVTGYGSNYDVIPDVGKWVLSVLMLIGRLEIYTVLILFTKSFWRK